MTDHTGRLPNDGEELDGRGLEMLMVYAANRPDSSLTFEVAR